MGEGGEIETLTSALGDALRFHDPVSIDGVPVEATLTPRDARSLGAALAALGAARCAAIPRGAGTQLGFGNVPRRAACFLSMEAFSGMDALDASEGVCHAGAGTPLAELRTRVAEAGWELPIDDAGRGGTLGGALATAALAPRALGWGRPRDVVLGCEVVLSDGTATRCGGRVVKNVTGYDMARLYTGSLGSLGVITGAWLRLRPRPEAVRVLQAGELDDQPDLGVLLLDGNVVAVNRRGKAALRAERHLPGGHVFAGLLDARLDLVLGLQRGQLAADQAEHHGLALRYEA